MREEWSFAAWALCRNLGCRQDRTGARLTLRQWRHCPHLTCYGYKACMWASWVPITDISGLHVSDFLHGVPCWTPVRWQQPGVKVTDLTGQIPADMELHLLAVACLLFGRIMMTHQTVHSMCYYSFFFFFLIIQFIHVQTAIMSPAQKETCLELEDYLMPGTDI